MCCLWPAFSYLMRHKILVYRFHMYQFPWKPEKVNHMICYHSCIMCVAIKLLLLLLLLLLIDQILVMIHSSRSHNNSFFQSEAFLLTQIMLTDNWFIVWVLNCIQIKYGDEVVEKQIINGTLHESKEIITDPCIHALVHFAQSSVILLMQLVTKLPLVVLTQR